MNASKPGTDRFSAEAFGETDFAKVDAHVIQPHEYEEIPELTDEWFEQADYRVGGELIRKGRGRPKSAAPKRQVTIRLDPDVLDGLRATGAGWQSRLNVLVREWLQKRSA